MNPQQPQQPIKQFQPGVAPVVPDGQGQIYAKGTGGPVVNDQSVPAMAPVKPSATTPQPLKVPQVGTFPPDPRKMASFNNKYLRIAKEWRKKTAEKAGITEKKALQWAVNNTTGFKDNASGSNYAGAGKATSQGQAGVYGGVGTSIPGRVPTQGVKPPVTTNPFDPDAPAAHLQKFGPLKYGLQSQLRERGQGPVTLKPQPQPTAAPYSSATPSSTTRATPAPFKSQWYVPSGNHPRFGGMAPYLGEGRPTGRSGAIEVKSQAHKDKLDNTYAASKAEQARRKALWHKNMRGKYSADKQGIASVKLALDMFRGRRS